MSKCDICHKESNEQMKSVVINDTFYSSVCAGCRSKGFKAPRDAAFQRARGREDNAKDIIQPFVNGQPNPDFAHAYPEQAKDMYTEDELAEM